MSSNRENESPVVASTAWYRQAKTEALEAHGSSLTHGLHQDEVEKRIAQYGYNKLQEVQRRGALSIFLTQFKDLFVLVLIAAALIASFVGEPQDTIAIVTIVLLNAILGFTQEYRAERAMEALKALASPFARVKRMGEVISLPAYELVPGDIVLLEAGNIVPADLRIIESHQLRIDEAALTGESAPVDKISEEILEDKVSVADQHNMAFKGTIATAGRAVGLVVQTGMNTELGRIAKLLKDEVEVNTPLKNRIARFAKGLALVVVALCLVIFALGLARGEPPLLMFMTALSLAVAGIPEALPAVVTMSLALGARRMSRRNALVRKLPAVEALGSVTYICTDKTGTLTQNQMQAQAFYVNNTIADSIPETWSENLSWVHFVRTLGLNNDVITQPGGKLQGDPTEVALALAAASVNQDKTVLESEFPRVAELPFSSERGLMSTVHKGQSGGFVLSKGAPERLLPLCKLQYGPSGVEPLTGAEIEEAVETLAAKGFRVLALAHRSLNKDISTFELSDFEEDLIFVGLVGLIDPPREEAKEAVALCQSSGIHVVMITGDHPITARAIASYLGITKTPDSEVITGEEIAELSDEQLEARVREIRVYARAAPEQKIRIVKALQSVGEIVAMTGDGVNDAPALRRADVGVSMGKGGTDVAREASHIVLLDDNFATIVAAVREGRRIYDNIRKFIRFALSGNSGEIWTLFLAPFLGLPTPLLPIHILWVNLVTDGLPGLALAMEPEEKRIMQRPPRSPRESIFSHGLWQHTVWVGILTAAATLGTMAWAYHTGHSHWQSMAFTVLTFVQMGHVLAIRSERESLFHIGVFSNLPLLGAVLFTLILQLGTLYIPYCNEVFKTQPLSAQELLICLVASSSVFIAVELEKWWIQRRTR